MSSVDVQGSPAHSGASAFPVPIKLAVHWQCGGRMGCFHWHHEAQRLLHPDPGGQPADEDLLRGHAGGEQDCHDAAGMGEGETSCCKIWLLYPQFCPPCAGRFILSSVLADRITTVAPPTRNLPLWKPHFLKPSPSISMNWQRPRPL